MKIKVTKEHIERGSQDCVHHCPIALAVRDSKIIEVLCDKFQTSFLAVKVSYWRLTFFNTVMCCDIENSDEISAFIRAYDTGKKVHPFAFELNPNNADQRI